MTNEEAIKTIEIAIADVEWNYPMDYAIAFENAISALEKQIPKKAIRASRAIEKDGQLFMNDDNEYWKCPMCANYDVPLRENQQYCHYCGQKIY